MLGIAGYPTTKGLDAVAASMAADPRQPQKTQALALLRDFLDALRRTSPELQTAFDGIPWGPGSPTEYQALDAALAEYAHLEAREAERRGAPRGAGRAREEPRPRPRVPVFEPDQRARPGATRYEALYERARRAGVETWQEMTAALDEATGDPDAPPPPSRECVDSVLRLQAEGMAEEADELTSMLARWLDGGREDRFDEALAQRWAVAQELALAALPSLVRRVVAQAVREGDIRRAAPYVRRFCAEEDPEAIEVLAAGMTTDAPTILAALADAFGQPPRR